MDIADIEKICRTFKGVTEDIKWENHLCFNVGGKMFLITAPDNVPITATFKVSEDEFDSVVEMQGFSPAPYMARYKWVFIDDINRLSRDEWRGYLKNSYDLVYAKLPVKIKKEIDARRR